MSVEYNAVSRFVVWHGIQISLVCRLMMNSKQNISNKATYMDAINLAVLCISACELIKWRHSNSGQDLTECYGFSSDNLIATKCVSIDSNVWCFEVQSLERKSVETRQIKFTLQACVFIKSIFKLWTAWSRLSATSVSQYHSCNIKMPTWPKTLKVLAKKAAHWNKSSGHKTSAISGLRLTNASRIFLCC